jgi:phage I-like protein
VKTPVGYISLHRTLEDGSASWFHTVPAIGEYPGGDIRHQGKPVKDAVLVIDRAALDSIRADFRAAMSDPAWPGMLVDREHFSLDSEKPSDAMAWARDIREDADGLWTRWEFTPPGAEAWQSKVLVSRSPVMGLEPLGGNRFRPVSLKSIAMTNVPHFELSTLAAARAADISTGDLPAALNEQGEPTMKKLLELLGLAPEATEEDAAAAVQALIDAKTSAEAQMKDAQAACRKADCDSFVSQHRESIADEAAFRAAFDKDPATAKAVFGAFRRAAPETRLSAREAKTPADAAPVTLAAYRAMRPGKDKDAYLAQNKETLLRLERDEKK